MCIAAAFMLATSRVRANLLENALLNIKDPTAILTEIEGMVSSGDTPASELISTIKSLILDQIMPGLQTTRESAAQETAEALEAVRLCNNQSKTQEGLIAGSEEAAVDGARSLHAACRDAEKVLYYHNLTHADSYCVKLGKFLHHADPLRINLGDSRVGSVIYVKKASDTNMCDLSGVTELDSGCTAKEHELSSKRSVCLAKQGQFELAFCTWKTVLESNCQNLDTCHSDAVSFYDNHVNKTQTLVKKWDVETAALHKILCYCSVWLSETDAGDDRSKHNATQFEACKVETYTSVSVDYGTPAAKVACLLTSVANHPGTSGFIAQEYADFTDFYKQVVPCMEATTAAPTTEAPSVMQDA